MIGQHAQRGGGECARDFDVERAEFIERDTAVALSQAKNALAQIVRVRAGRAGMQPRRRIETGQRDVDAVGAGSGNQSEVKLRGAGHAYFASATCVASSVLSLASIGWVWPWKRASSTCGSGSGFGSVTLSGSRCVPSMRNS